MSKNLFGMFIHWGIYSLTGLQEQALVRYSMNRDEYESLLKVFNPTSFNAEKWIKIAKKAGMEYICFTVKHHDGFCMWDTNFSDYKITNTPYSKDVLKELSTACQKYGIKLSLYYSNPDWHYKSGYNPNSSHQWCAVNKDAPNLEEYKEYVKNQVTELLTNYGPIYTFFWDIPPKIDDPSFNELVRKLQPGIFINDRGWGEGDFSTPEREYKATEGERFTRMTEACNSVGQQSWGYREKEDFYTKRHLCCAVDRIMAMGGSYILNVGPDAKGVITDKYADKLMAVADWYNRMEGCLECAEADEFNYESRHNACIATKKNGKTYLHFYNGIISEAVALKSYPSLPKKVKLMNNGKELSFAIERLPEFFNGKTGKAEIPFLHIYGIPADDFISEPIVLEVEW